MCAAAFVNAGVEIVHYAREYRKSDGLDILTEAGIVLEPMPPKDLVPALYHEFSLNVESSAFGWKVE